MNKTLKVWHHFIAAHMILVIHLTEMTKDHTFLLFNTHLGQSIDVGHRICQTILYETRH